MCDNTLYVNKCIRMYVCVNMRKNVYVCMCSDPHMDLRKHAYMYVFIFTYIRAAESTTGRMSNLEPNMPKQLSDARSRVSSNSSDYICTFLEC